MQHIAIYVIEDGNWRDLRPITDLRPAALVAVGALTLLDRVSRAFPSHDVLLVTRPSLIPALKSAVIPIAEPGPMGPGLYVNGRVLGSPGFFQQIAQWISGDQLMVLAQDETLLAAFVPPNHPALPTLDRQIPDWSEIKSLALLQAFSAFVTPVGVTGVPVINAVWDVPGLMEVGLRLDATRFPLGLTLGALAPHVATYDSAAIHVAADAQIEPFVVLDARSGPIVIDSGAVIESHSRIDGPAYIGPRARVVGGRIRACAIGAHCKVSGEMSQTVMAPYSNKSHDGFWGNSYIGGWVNIGANSVTSNLKNTYGNVSVQIDTQRVITNTQFLGAIVGDHARLGIGTHLTTGTIIGTGACLTGTAIHAKSIPNFSWGSVGAYGIARLPETLTTIDRMMGRRQQVLSPNYESLFTQLYFETGGRL